MTKTAWNFEDGTVGVKYEIDTPANTSAATNALCSNAHPAHGTKGIRVDPAGSYQYVEKHLAAPLSSLVFALDIRPEAATTGGTLELLRLSDSTTDTTLAHRALEVRVIATNKLRIVDATGATIWTQTGTLSSTNHTRLEGKLVCGLAGAADLYVRVVDAGATDGSANGTALLEAWDNVTVSPATNMTTTANVNTWRAGKQTTAAVTGGVFHNLDDIQIGDNLTTDWPPGPATAIVPPVCDAGLPQTGLNPYQTVTQTGTFSDPDGTVVSKVWTLEPGGAASSVAINDHGDGTFDYPVPATLNGGDLVFKFTVTDNEGNTAFDTVTHSILPHTIWRLDAGGVNTPISWIQL